MALPSRCVKWGAEGSNENPPRISPGGPQVVSAIAATGTSAVSSFVASDTGYIGGNCEDSMTGCRSERSARPAGALLDIARELTSMCRNPQKWRRGECKKNATAESARRDRSEVCSPGKRKPPNASSHVRGLYAFNALGCENNLYFSDRSSVIRRGDLHRGQGGSHVATTPSGSCRASY
jgi:hypothetical protein